MSRLYSLLCSGFQTSTPIRQLTSINPSFVFQKTSQKGGKVLVIPWDYRIPKIRISTRQVEQLKDHRIIVRIDSWEIDSQYPNGHFVRSLGKIGDLETEIAAILMENSISVPPFSDVQVYRGVSQYTDT